MVLHRRNIIVGDLFLTIQFSKLSFDDTLANYVPLTSIFSTRVITGAKSTPDLNKLLARKQAGRTYIKIEHFKNF